MCLEKRESNPGSVTEEQLIFPIVFFFFFFLAEFTECCAVEEGRRGLERCYFVLQLKERAALCSSRMRNGAAASAALFINILLPSRGQRTGGQGCGQGYRQRKWGRIWAVEVGRNVDREGGQGCKQR